MPDHTIQPGDRLRHCGHVGRTDQHCQVFSLATGGIPWAIICDACWRRWGNRCRLPVVGTWAGEAGVIEALADVGRN